MGAPEAPYLYSPPSHAGFDFNPRAYSQAAYAASVQSSSPRPKQNGPLVDLNRHPDSWMPVTPSLQEYKPLPDNMRAKIITCRGIQFALRLPELLGALGLLVCAISFQGMQATQGWIVRIPPGFDALIGLYAIYHLARAAHSRPAGSAASYHLFAFAMDAGLIPFYVLYGIYSYSNYKQAPGTEGRWRTFFKEAGATEWVLHTSWLGAFVMAGLHLISLVLDFLLLIWFRRISNLPPDHNPLDVDKTRSKHRYKNSEMSSTTLASEDKKIYRVSTHSYASNADIPSGYEIPSPVSRQVPFFRSRVEGGPKYSPHTQQSAQFANSQYKAADVRSVRSKGPRASVIEQENNDKHSPYAGHSFPFPPGQDRASFNASRPGSRDRPSSAQAAQDPRNARQAQSQSLLRENWVSHGAESDDIGSRRNAELLGAYGAAGGKENAAPGVRRMGTVSSSVYSDDGAAPGTPDIVRASKYYGDLAVAQQAVRYQGGSPVPMAIVDNNRVVSSSGVDITDARGYDESRQRNVSGKTAEEGRGGSAWERRMR